MSLFLGMTFFGLLNPVGITSINNISQSELNDTPINTKTNSLDYLGEYSFLDDTNGAYPVGWRVYEPSYTSLQILESKGTHHKVAGLLCYGSDWDACGMWNNFSPQTSGSIEFWTYIVAIEPRYGGASDATELLISLLNTSSSFPYFDVNSFGPMLGFEAGGTINYNAGYSNLITIGFWTANKWQHYRIDFNTETDKFDVYQDGIQIGTQCGFRYTQTALNKAFIGYGWAQSHSVECEAYVDAIDFSWAPGYSMNRNIDYEIYLADYLGAYSFTEDTIDSVPVGWTASAPSGTSFKVIALEQNHKQVVQFDDTSTSNGCHVYNVFSSPRASGTIEYWLYRYSGWTGDGCFWWGFRDGGNALFSIVVWGTNIGTDNNQQLVPFSDDTWHHVRVHFNCSTSKAEWWFDGNYQGQFNFGLSSATIDRLYIFTWSSMKTKALADAIDYSWAQGYYTNRNMDYGLKAYLGAYSFTEDADGANPAGWTISEPSGTSVSVITNQKGHEKVVKLSDNTASTFCYIENSLAASQVTGNVELWLYCESGGITPYFYIYWYSGGSQKRQIPFNWAGGDILDNDFSLIANDVLIYDQWQHFRFEFNCVLNPDIINIYVDSNFVGNSTKQNSDATSFDKIKLLFAGTGGSGALYVDAIDYSWAPSYYTNRNMKYFLNEASFEEEEEEQIKPFDFLPLILIICGIIVAIGVALSVYFNYRPHGRQRNEPPQPSRRPRTQSNVPIPYSETIRVPPQYSPRVQTPPSTEPIEPQSDIPASASAQAPLPSLYCPMCGARHEKDQLFCSQCGSEL